MFSKRPFCSEVNSKRQSVCVCGGGEAGRLSWPTCGQHGRRVSVLVELQVLPDQLVEEQVFVRQRRPRLALVLQGAEHLRPDASLQLAQHAPRLQRFFHCWKVRDFTGLQRSCVVLWKDNFGSNTLAKLHSIISELYGPLCVNKDICLVQRWSNVESESFITTFQFGIHM